MKTKFLVMVSVLGCLQACSGEAVKRTSYETLQNIREKECYKTPSIDCEKRERLEVYEEQRQDVEGSN